MSFDLFYFPLYLASIKAKSLSFSHSPSTHYSSFSFPRGFLASSLFSESSYLVFLSLPPLSYPLSNFLPTPPACLWLCFFPVSFISSFPSRLPFVLQFLSRFVRFPSHSYPFRSSPFLTLSRVCAVLFLSFHSTFISILS